MHLDDRQLLTVGGRNLRKSGRESNCCTVRGGRGDEQPRTRGAGDQRAVDAAPIDGPCGGRRIGVRRCPQRELFVDCSRQTGRRRAYDAERQVVWLRLVKGADVRDNEQALHQEHDAEGDDESDQPWRPGRRPRGRYTVGCRGPVTRGHAVHPWIQPGARFRLIVRSG